MRFRMLSVLAGILTLSWATVPAAHAQPPDLLTISPGLLTPPATGVGSTSDAYFPYLIIYNPGPSPVTITSITISGRNASDYAVDASACPLSPNVLSPGLTCQPLVSFTPTAVGLRRASVVVKDVGGATQSVPIAAQGLATTYGVSFSSPQVVFAETLVGIPITSAPEAFVQINSTGTAPLNITSIGIAGPNAADFQIVLNSCTPGPLPSPCYLNIGFSPTAMGARHASLQVADNAPGGVQSLPILGVGGAPENMLQFFPAAVAFAPSSSSGSDSAQVTVSNLGSTPVTINGYVLDGPNATDFSLIGDSCQPIPYTLDVDNGCFVSLLFNPSATGPRFANLRFIDSASGSPQVIPLEGTGLTSNIDLSFGTSLLDFGPSTLGISAPISVFLTNTGGGTAQVNLQVKGPNASDFAVYPTSCSVPCFLTVGFTPSAPSLRVALLIATDSASGASRSLLLVGSGLPSGAPLSFGTPNFPNEPIGTTSPPSDIYVDSFSSSPITITGITVTGGNSADFAILQDTCPVGSPLPAYSSCSLQITFTPSAAGPRVAALNFNYSGESAALVLPLPATGLATTRQIAFNPSTLDVGAVPPGDTTSSTVLIQNTGGAAVSITGLSLAGNNAADFAITGNQCPQPPETLAIGANCLVTLQLTPSALGTRIARLQVADNASGSPQNLPLVGFGTNNVNAILQINPSSLSFSPQPLGSSYEDLISLYAYGPGLPVSLTSIQVAGAAASDYALVNDCPPVLASGGASCILFVTFTPSVSGLRSAYIEIQDNAIANPQIIPLAGMGVQAVPSQSISLSPIPLAFQPQAIGYAASGAITVQNTGTENVLLTGFHIGGRSGSDYGIQSNACPFSPAPLPPSGSCQISVAFTPAATGLRVATFQISDNVPGSPQSISIVGLGVPAVKTLQVSPSSVTFTPTPVGTTDYDGGSVSIYNSGTAPVTFSSFSITGANAGDFTASDNSCTGFGPAILDPGYSCQVYLSFTPSAVGTRTGALNIASDAAGSPAVVPMTGTGE